MMSITASTVTVTMIVACVLIVRRACVPASDDFHASHSPVNAANTETIAPPMNAYVPACHISRDQLWCLPPMTESTSKTAASMYAAIGMSVSGGCNGFPDQPRSPLNVRPLSVSVGRTENFLGTTPPVFDDAMQSLPADTGEREELLTRTTVVAEQPVHGRGDRARPHRLHAAHRHARVLGLQHDTDALRPQLRVETVGDLLREPLLHLEPAREQL